MIEKNIQTSKFQCFPNLNLKLKSCAVSFVVVLVLFFSELGISNLVLFFFTQRHFGNLSIIISASHHWYWHLHWHCKRFIFVWRNFFLIYTSIFFLVLRYLTSVSLWLGVRIHKLLACSSNENLSKFLELLFEDTNGDGTVFSRVAEYRKLSCYFTEIWFHQKRSPSIFVNSQNAYWKHGVS